MSTNKSSTGPLVLEIAPQIFRNYCESSIFIHLSMEGISIDVSAGISVGMVGLN